MRLLDYIREKTEDGKVLADKALRILMDEETSTQNGKDGMPVSVSPSIAEKLAALKWLSDAGALLPDRKIISKLEAERDEEVTRQAEALLEAEASRRRMESLEKQLQAFKEEQEILDED